MHERLARLLEAGAVHALQQSINAVIEKGKDRAHTLRDLRERLDAVEKDVARLNGNRKKGNG